MQILADNNDPLFFFRNDRNDRNDTIQLLLHDILFQVKSSIQSSSFLNNKTRSTRIRMNLTSPNIISNRCLSLCTMALSTKTKSQNKV